MLRKCVYSELHACTVGLCLLSIDTVPEYLQGLPLLRLASCLTTHMSVQTAVMSLSNLSCLLHAKEAEIVGGCCCTFHILARAFVFSNSNLHLGHMHHLLFCTFIVTDWGRRGVNFRTCQSTPLSVGFAWSVCMRHGMQKHNASDLMFAFSCTVVRWLLPAHVQPFA